MHYWTGLACCRNAPHQACEGCSLDEETATKKNLSIVAAVTIVDVPKHGPVLLQVNEAVLNESADHSLMSTYQMSEFGVPIDARPTRHGGVKA